MTSRRTVLAGLAASAAALAIPQSEPVVFNAWHYIRDLRATGVVVEVYGTMVALDLRGCDDDAYMAVCLKYDAARRADPLRNAKVTAALLVEAEDHV